METTIVYGDHIGDMLGLYRDSGKENGNFGKRCFGRLGFRV